ncbi:hypothetical protein AB0F17_55850 [Nonomuraea sp. NPDC026600]|uniref:hypothetical protein n=1 Tax=Nonomuraea sp. NPDC026600 TaxID=3155363 RepID=UPI0033CAABF5
MEPYPFFTPLPAATADSVTVKGWFYLRKAQVAALCDSRTARSGFDLDAMEALRRKLTTFETRVSLNEMTPGTAITQFQQWLKDDGDRGAWQAYVDDQTTKDDIERERQRVEAEARKITDAETAARSTAMSICNRHSAGLLSNREGAPVGRVVCGMAVIGSPGVTYEGFSGQDMHGLVTNPLITPLITELVRGITQSENWPPESCAEVDALKRWLNGPGAGVNSIKEIPGDIFVFHARVWHPGGTWGGKKTSQGWKDRGACVYCQHWIKRIGAKSV